MPLSPLILKNLEDIKDGWHFGDGAAITKPALLTANTILQNITFNPLFVEAFPLTSGGISIRIGITLEKVLGVVISHDSTQNVSVYFDDNKTIQNLGGVNIDSIGHLPRPKGRSL